LNLYQLEVLKAKYKLEPSLKDVYVEGTDTGFYKWFFDAKGIKDVKVYPIDIVEIHKDIIRKYGLRWCSSQSKVIALSKELSQFFGDDIKVKCVVDADFDRYLGKIESNSILEYTDYTSLEMYFFNEKVLKKIEIAVNGLPMESQVILNNIANVLERVFLIRLTNEKLQWGMSFLEDKSFNSYFDWNCEKIVFDETRFIKNYLIKNGKYGRVIEFKKVMSKFEKEMHDDVRNNIRGHDFSWALFRLIKKIKGKTGFKNWKNFEHWLCLSLELGYIENEQLFCKLAKLAS
jgi:hypothetical protein